MINNIIKASSLKNIIVGLFILLILSPVTGELWRLPLAGFEFLPSDLIIPILFVVWVIYKIKYDRKLRFGKIGKMIVVFLFVLTITYLINLFRFNWKEMVMAFSYLGRYGMYLILPIILFDVLNCCGESQGGHKSQILNPKFEINSKSHLDKVGTKQILILLAMITSMVLIVIMGFLQLKYFPSFLELGMHIKGWDPHIGRLLSTWFDPNFIGGYLSFVLGLVISLCLYFWHNYWSPPEKRSSRMWFIIMSSIALMGVIALYLTFSRSGYLAFIAVLGLLALFKSRRLLVAGALIVVLAFSFSPRVQERSLEAWDSGKALLGLDSQKPLDPTASLRVYSWKFAWEIIEDYPWVGAGYSRYAYEINQRGRGLLGGHASGGSDSSLLTIWATSGIFGLLSYLSIGFVAAAIAIRRLWKKKDLRSYIDSGLVAGFGGMMIHSVFVNSLLFPLMMVYLMMGLGLLDEK